MIQRYACGKVTWVDLETPTAEEIRSIMEEFSLPELVGDELRNPTLRSRVDSYGEFVYLILHLPSRGNTSAVDEIDFVIGNHFIITTHYAELDPLLEFGKAFEAGSILNRGNMGEHAGFTFFYMMRLIYSTLEGKLDRIEQAIMSIEDQIFDGHERAMVSELSKQARLLLNFKNATDSHESILESFEKAILSLFGKDFSYYMSYIQGESRKVRNSIATKRSYIAELRETNDSLLNSKQNEIMKTFTVLAFVFLPLSFVASIFGMNSDSLPLINTAEGFPIIMAGMAAFALCCITFFKYKDWL